MPDDETDVPEPPSERANARGWRVVSGPAHGPEPERDELRSLIQGMRPPGRNPGRRKVEEEEPPEAA
jgi:hypothetical protein